MSDPLSQITNFTPISDTFATAGQPAADQFAAIKAAGYDMVLNLAEPDDDNAIANEEELVTGQGMAYIHMPVDWDDPQQEDFEAFAQTLNDNRDRRIFVHCEFNRRGSAFMFLYRAIHLEVDPSEAKAPMKQIWDPYGVWEAFVDEILSNHDIDYFDIE